MSLNDFHIIKELGKGVFGTVYLATRKQDNNRYAIKQVNFSNLKQKDISNSLNEIRILASISHPNIIAYKESFYDPTTKTLNLVLEYADEGDLQTKITNHKTSNTHFPENEIWTIFIQMVLGLNELHKHKIMHRDLKSANIFLTKNGFCKLGDMNVSKVMKEGLLHTQTGTPYYASPEVWMDKPYNCKSDIWSIGCILYEICALSLPFKGKTFDNVYKNVIKGVYNPIPSYYSKELSQVIFGLLQINPNNRPTSEQILKHSIIKENANKYMNDNIKKILFPYMDISIPKRNKNISNEQNDCLLKTLYITNEKEIENVLPKNKNYNSNSKRYYNSNKSDKLLLINISKTKRCFTNNHSLHKLKHNNIISPKSKINNSNGNRILHKELINVDKYISHNNSKSKYTNCYSVHDNKKIQYHLDQNNILPHNTNENNKCMHLSKKRSLTKNYSVSSITLQPIHKYSKHFSSNTNINNRNHLPDTQNTTASNSNATQNSSRKNGATILRPKSTKHLRSKTPNKEQLRVINSNTDMIKIIYKKDKGSNNNLEKGNCNKNKNLQHIPKPPSCYGKFKDEEIDPFKKMLINPFRVVEDKSLKKVVKNNNPPNYKYSGNNVMSSNQITRSLGNNISKDNII